MKTQRRGWGVVLAIVLAGCGSASKRTSNSPLALNPEQLIGFYSNNHFKDSDFESYFSEDRSLYVVCKLKGTEPPRGMERLKTLLLRGLPSDHLSQCCRMICYQKANTPCLVAGNRTVFDQFTLRYQGVASDRSTSSAR